MQTGKQIDTQTGGKTERKTRMDGQSKNWTNRQPDGERWTVDGQTVDGWTGGRVDGQTGGRRTGRRTDDIKTDRPKFDFFKQRKIDIMTVHFGGGKLTCFAYKHVLFDN